MKLMKYEEKFEDIQKDSIESKEICGWRQSFVTNIG